MARTVNAQSEQSGAEATLENKVAMLYDGSNEDGRFLAVSLASRGADIAIVYRKDCVKHARETKKLVEAEGRRCLIVPFQEGKVVSRDLIRKTTSTLGRLDIFIDSSSPPTEGNSSVDAGGDAS